MYYYEIAEVGIKLDTDKKIDSSQKFKLFEIDKNKFDMLKNKIIFKVTNNNMPIKNKSKVIHEGIESFVQKDYNGNIWFLRSGSTSHLCHIDYNNGDHEIIIDQNNKVIPKTWQLFEVMNVVKIFAQFNTLILHSSFISYKDKGIIFTGPSGIGKSTQADLWAKYQNSNIINGDRTLLKKSGGKWFGYGFPYSGSSNHCLNESYEIKFIVVLEQGDKNEIKKLSGIEKLKYVYSQIAINKWDKELNITIINLVEKLLSDVEVIKLSCLPNEESVEELKKFIEGMC
ncbi:MAG: hypothetical protein E6611_07425 [Intestinibacter bartlettii]|uniref:hypothetical protein n=1 Tax=Intestinibacter bartlettii TaxID=261299 RepID=UPI00291377D0|nr:hypothetical protein [Intestinibacter bartlettii]MDU6198548.1 hypothetical protein [Intestinibacter bartlettii]